MKIRTFSQTKKDYKYAVIVEDKYLDINKLWDDYFHKVNIVDPSHKEDILFIGVSYDKEKSPSAAHIKSELEQVKKVLDTHNIKNLWFLDNNYFRYITRLTNPTGYYGQIVKSVRKDFEGYDCLINITPRNLFLNPSLKHSLIFNSKTYLSIINGTYKIPGSDIIHSVKYIHRYNDFVEWLEKLLKHPSLAIDIETDGLQPHSDSMLSIAFSWDKHNGVVVEWPKRYNQPYIQALKSFFKRYEGKKIFHNATFDIKHILSNIFKIENIFQTSDGLVFKKKYDDFISFFHTITNNVEDTFVMAYLCLNNVSGNSLSLEVLAQPYAGKWGLENMDNLKQYPIEEVMEYNFIDTLATNYLYELYKDQLIAEDQVNTYESVFKPSIKTLAFMELVGFPIDTRERTYLELNLNRVRNDNLDKIQNSSVISLLNMLIREEEAEKANKKLKKLRKTADDFDTVFSHTSSNHLRYLLHKVFKLPVIDRTPTGLPVTGEDTLEKLKEEATSQKHKDIITSLIEVSKTEKILNTFIPAFQKTTKPILNSQLRWYQDHEIEFLQGNFKLGGTVSGRLSSSSPNLTNIPAGSAYGRAVKKIFRAPKGWILVSIDYAALEERINTMLTKDPSKEAVYIDGYDGHSLRMYHYWKDKFTNIDPTPENINKLGKDNPELREKSKPVTFALQYFGTYKTIMKQGFTVSEAQQIYNSFYNLYKVSNDWVNSKLDEAADKGYGVGAFGLKIRCPLLGKTISGSKVSLKEAESQRRTLGNAISGQSYGLLNSRAMNAVMDRVWASKTYYNQVFPVGQIHDAGMYLIKDDVTTLEWFNKVVIEEMEWKELPELKESSIPLVAELEVLYPSWADPISIPNNASQEKISEIVEEYLDGLDNSNK